MTTSQHTYQVNLHHKGGFIRSHKVQAPTKAQAVSQVTALYPPVVVVKTVAWVVK